MKTKLTKKQKAKVTEYKNKYFNQAISIDRADKPRAEAAAQKLAEIGGVKNPKIIWVSSPDEKDTICESLSATLWDSLRSSLRDPLWDSLRDPLWDSLRDSGWLCYYTYVVEMLKIKCDNKTLELLNLHNEIASSCFAIWITPNSIILCDRPTSVTIEDGNVVDMKW
jgi:phosphatidylinositol kinase/protein kinase (PI-3  family)